MADKSIFEEEYYYWRFVRKQAHIVAKRKAIDYYRKFTKREYTDYDHLHSMEDERPSNSPETLLQFNQTVNVLLTVDAEYQPQKVKRYVALCIYKERLFNDLNDENRALVRQLASEGEENESRGDLAKALGYKLNKSGSCSTMFHIYESVRDVYAQTQ